MSKDINAPRSDTTSAKPGSQQKSSNAPGKPSSSRTGNEKNEKNQPRKAS